MIQLPAEFRANLESYRGPLDLLLYLIKKDELNIFDIPISRITGQYMTYLQILKDVDPNVCGEFLVMAAQLMELKSKTLLPTPPAPQDAEELEDPRLELVLQLLEYKKYKERALLIEQMAEEHQRRYRRPDLELAASAELQGPRFQVGSVSIWDLLTAYQKVELALSLRQPHRVLFEDRPIEHYIEAIFEQLGEGIEGRLLFSTLFETCRDRYDAIGFFLALLELAKRSLILIEQDELFGEISIRRNPAPPPALEETLAEASDGSTAPSAGGEPEALVAPPLESAEAPQDEDAGSRDAPEPA